MLSEKDFKQIIQNTPLISIDLIVKNINGQYLLGYRTNKPAKDTWFVPGGRIKKGETIEQAFSRITTAELGIEFKLKQAEYLGLYEHIYPNDNYFNDSEIGTTHYIVHGFQIDLESNLNTLPKEQHADYWWASKEELLNNENVHINTKNYFNGFRLL